LKLINYKRAVTVETIVNSNCTTLQYKSSSQTWWACEYVGSHDFGHMTMVDHMTLVT